jgi:hypothetical protein
MTGTKSGTCASPGSEAQTGLLGEGTSYDSDSDDIWDDDLLSGRVTGIVMYAQPIGSETISELETDLLVSALVAFEALPGIVE